MRATGASVPESVRELVSRNRSVYDCIRAGLINYTALGAKLRPEVERRAGGPVNLNTIVVAIKRYADALGPGGGAGGGPALRGARISLTDGVVDVRIPAGGAGGLTDLLEKFSRVTDDYDLRVVPGALRLLAEDLEGVRSIMRGMGGGGGSLRDGLVRIRVSVPRGAGAGAGPYVVGLLHENGVAVVDAYLDGDGMVITLERGDGPRAYGLLRSEVGG